jgi:hypothetical protein
MANWAIKSKPDDLYLGSTLSKSEQFLAIQHKELDAYLQEVVPELTAKYKGTPQYPARGVVPI